MDDQCNFLELSVSFVMRSPVVCQNYIIFSILIKLLQISLSLILFSPFWYSSSGSQLYVSLVHQTHIPGSCTKSLLLLRASLYYKLSYFWSRCPQHRSYLLTLKSHVCEGHIILLPYTGHFRVWTERDHHLIMHIWHSTRRTI